jgi:hypothetical protein
MHSSTAAHATEAAVGNGQQMPDERICASQEWSRLGESSPEPAHYEEAVPRLLWRLPATTVAVLTPLSALAAPLDLSSHHV